ncbi:ImmA/IrrE family metallo-endopeptidase [Pengzhenrongella sicca]|uniref:ImmA/IrrE family metallo-endopeptidase n=2 Tax=Pengzhenrongella sicca TaxID=2819238 RepID=A0A8A4ZGC7_9MICO|nr:ImmA/IrrE family metallo-endopeptidase [Pengzhenrongella sicca]
MTPGTNLGAFNAPAIADSLRGLTADPDRPNLYEIAQALGVRSITTDSYLDRLGHTSWYGGSPAIVLQGGQAPSRQRFTLAHELAHTFLRHGRTDDSGLSAAPATRPHFRREEWQADSVAGCLLVPEYAVARLRDHRNDDGSSIATLADIRQTAATYRVSNSVVARRLSDFDQSRHWLLINLKRLPRGHWFTWRIIGRLRGIDAVMEVLESNDSIFDSLSDRDSSIVFLARFGNHIFQLSGSGNRRDDLILILVDRVRRV